MERMVYNPRAYVFTKGRTGAIHDVSEFVTAGEVRRVVNAVSSATVTLRNPNMMFTKPDSAGNVTFSPMDPITIYLERLKGYPVRVFTGFLDTAPYLQLYPGTIQLEASCTLKRLQYTFFDPALPYTQSFLSNYGWINNNGTVFSLEGLNDWQKEDKDIQDRFGDGSLASLLAATLIHIGNWDENSIYIEKLPSDIFERLAALQAQVNNANEAVLEEFNSMLKKIIGSGSYGSPDGSTNSGADVGNITGTDVPVVVYKVGIAMNVPERHLLAAMATGLVEAPNGKGSFGNPKGGDLTGVPGAPATRKSAGWRQETEAYYGKYDANPKTARTNVVAASKRFYQECKAEDHGQDVGVLCQDVQGSAYPAKYPAVMPQAQALLKRVKEKVDNESDADDPDADTSGQEADTQKNRFRAAGLPPESTTRASRTPSSNKSETTKKIYKPLPAATETAKDSNYGEFRQYYNNGAGGRHAGWDISVPVGSACVAPCDGKIVGFAQTTGFSGGGMIQFQFTEQVGGIKAGTVIGWGHVQSVNKKVGDTVRGGEIIARSGYPSAPHVHFIQRSDSADMDGSENPTALFVALQKGETTTTSGGDTDDGGGTTGGGDTSEGGLAFANAFAVTFNFPTIQESIEAVGLTGNKSLMNDQPLLPFIQQLCESSLRQFQSLPDGRFFAFYPDYFGEMLQHPPYWEIDDIEVLDGGISLSDDALVTHMYVVGDTSWPASEGMVNKLTTSGVMTVFDAFLTGQIAGVPIVEAEVKKKGKDKDSKKDDPTSGMNMLLTKDQAATFLERFGARPMVEDMPMLKSHFFEFFVAYQRFLLAWARQFISTFQFTFMPELYPGGKVGFRDHGLQMYVEDVTHSWNYETGFLTSANLSAPSVYGENKKGLPPNMVRAIVNFDGG